jgi:hypothetical protein
MMNVSGIILYLLITSYVTIYVGQVLYKNGRHFIVEMLHDEQLTEFVNKVLLVGYYLLNLGYVSVMLTHVRRADSLSELIPSLSIAIGRILVTLGIMHCLNITAIVAWNKLKKH